MILDLRAAWTAMRVRIALPGIAALLSVACHDKPLPSGFADLREVPVVAPFDQLNLPTSGGKVWQCTGPGTLRDPATIHVAYDGADKMVLGGRYSTAITGIGWARRKPPTVTPDRWLSLYDDPDTGRMMTMVIADSTFDGRVPHGVDLTITIMIARPR